jgi:hypothetical protein
MGAQDRAHWNVESTDLVEAAAGGFNAALRDYGRFGMLMTNDGACLTDSGAIEIITREFVLDATDAARQPAGFTPRVAAIFWLWLSSLVAAQQDAHFCIARY